jgi:hypothetical protein
MKRQQFISRLAGVALAAASLAGFGCGGGSSSTTSSAPLAAFTPDTASPGAATIALEPGTVSGTVVTVRVTVTGVPNFFGAAFRITYDPTALQYSGMTNSTSLLRSGGVTDADVFFLDSPSVPGQVVITATRLDPTVAPPVPVTTTSDLVVVTFVARKAIAAAAVEGRLDFTDPKQVCDGTSAPPGCGAVAVTWSGGGVSAQ